MQEDNIQILSSKLKRRLDPERYEHTLGVAYTAAALAMRYSCDIDKTYIAGLLHDCAKCIPDEIKVQKCKKHNISINETEEEVPYLLHAKLGAFLAMDKYGVTDKDVVNAILYHTVGRPHMTLIEKIIFVADYIEPGRYKAENLPEIRSLAFVDLDKCVYRILQDTIAYLKTTKGPIDEATIITYDYYRSKFENTGETK